MYPASYFEVFPESPFNYLLLYSFDFFETEYDRPVTQIYLSGGTSLLDGICEVLSSLFGKPVENWDPLRKVEVKATGTAGELLRRNAAKFAVAVGLGARIWG